MQITVTCPHCCKTNPMWIDYSSIPSCQMAASPTCPSCHKVVHVEFRNGQIYRVE